MNPYELVGYLASMLVLATFCMQDMVPLRVLAIASNVAFIAYAGLADIDPVLLLHALLLPMNTWRLLQAIAARRSDLRQPDDAAEDIGEDTGKERTAHRSTRS